MRYHVMDAKQISGFILRLKFRDGTEGDLDLAPELTGPMFEPLKDPEQFKLFRIHPEFHTLVWPNGADFAPEFLYEHVRVNA
jgi:Protein of unknown function (DUF2442)